MANFVIELLVALLMLIGAGFAFVGSYGLAKLPNIMTRLHAPTKASTLGVGGIILASIACFGLLERELSLHELLIALFIFITAPVSALMIAKAHIFRVRGDTQPALPPTGGPVGWATLDEPIPDAVSLDRGRAKAPQEAAGGAEVPPPAGR